MSIFFTADTHFNHSNIIKYCHRPFLTDLDRQALEANGGQWHNGQWKGKFASDWKVTKEATQMMNDHFIDNINKMVGPNDTLWHLGDFCFSQKHLRYETCLEFRNRIKCKNVNIIWGNHDSPAETYKVFNKNYDLYTLKDRLLPANIVLCHYSMLVWNKHHRGNWHLYGHSHTNVESWSDKFMPGRRSLDVGVDNAFRLLGDYRPFSIDDLIKLMNDRNGFYMDHHVSSDAPTEEELIDYKDIKNA